MVRAVATREEVIRRMQAVEQQVRSLGVQRLALFGSFARDLVHAGSDVDLLVEFAPGSKTYDAFLGLSELLENLLQRRVEVVTVEALSPYIGPRILAEAQDVLRAA